MLELAVALPLLALFLLLALPYYQLRHSRRARLAAHLPGPSPWPLIGNALEFGSGSPVDVQAALTRLWKQYGETYKLWIGPLFFVVISDRKYMEQFLTSNVNITKNLSYRFLDPWLGTGLLTSTGNKWRHHRKVITPTFHFKILEEFVEVFNSNGNTLIEKLKKKANGEDFDVYPYITLCALDIICETAMGVQMNVQNDGNSHYVAAIKGMADIIMRRSFTPWLHPSIIFGMTSLGKSQKKYLKVLHDTTNKVIEDRIKELEEKAKEVKEPSEDGTEFKKKRLAFLDLLLEHNREGGQFTKEEIREEVDTFMFEGHDTTASGISFCLLLLAQHPECQEKVYDELYQIFEKSDREATMKDLQDMKYLECVIKESQRVYPSVPFFARELEEDVHYEGLDLVRGTNVMFTPLFLHHNPEMFPDPERFDPERFSPEQSVGRSPYAFLPFSAGPRNCIGQKFAMLEMKSAVSKIIRNFKLSPGSQKITLSAELVLRTVEGIHIKMEKRL